MAKQVTLAELIDALDMQNDQISAYLDRDTGTVGMIGEDIVSLSRQNESDQWADWERELIEVLRRIEEGSQRYVQLPTQRDVHEWDIMRRFCETVEDARSRDYLERALDGRGAYRRFKDALDRDGLLQRWFDFKRNALRELAVEWCEDNDVVFDSLEK